MADKNDIHDATYQALKRDRKESDTSRSIWAVVTVLLILAGIVAAFWWYLR